MMSSKLEVVLTLDENLDSIAVMIDGKTATYCEDGPPEPREKGTVIASKGRDPENGEGIEVIQIGACRLVHYYCHWFIVCD